MIEIRKTDHFVQWLDDLSDFQARARIQARIERLVTGNLAMSSRLVKASRSCESITVPVTGFILKSGGEN